MRFGPANALCDGDKGVSHDIRTEQIRSDQHRRCAPNFARDFSELPGSNALSSGTEPGTGGTVTGGDRFWKAVAICLRSDLSAMRRYAEPC